MKAPFLSLAAVPFVLAALSFVPSAPAQSVADLVARGDALDASQETAKALTLYLEAEKVNPNDPDLLIKIATQYGESMVDAANEAAEKAAGDKALAYALRAVQLDPDLSDAHLAVAICYGRLLDFMPAREKVEYSRKVKVHTEKAIELDPGSDYAWHMLGRWHRAVANTNPFLKGFVKVVYGGLPSASVDEAAESLEKATQLRPDRVSHHVELGLTYLDLGRTADAEKAIKRGLSLPSEERDDPDTKARGRQALSELEG